MSAPVYVQDLPAENTAQEVATVMSPSPDVKAILIYNSSFKFTIPFNRQLPGNLG